MNRQLNLAFGKALKQARRHKKLSQEALALDAGLDRTYISLLELGRRSPTLDTIDAVCTALNISLVQFITLVQQKLNEEP